jgi:hypothetical protein
MAGLWLAAAGMWVAAQVQAAACPEAAQVCARRSAGALPLIIKGHTATLMADPDDDPGVLRAVKNLGLDLSKVAGQPSQPLPSQELGAIIVGTIGHSQLIDEMVRAGKLDVTGVAGVWEAFAWQVVEKPVTGVERALVIAGADRRGAIFGAYELSRAAGVSPWHWWADVPVKQAGALYVTAGRRIDFPRVRYRGIFLNDEEPALGGWVREKFGGFNHQFYEHVFDLVLRHKANYLWPAMWGKAIYDDDPRSAPLAHEMGVVLGTSHHEPLTRAHVEWRRHGKGAWDYNKNDAELRRFWRSALERMGRNESVITVGMRGDGDEAMTEGTAIALLERIVRDQRQLIADVTGRPAAQTPQVWALYKEVQDYYDQGMQVPDDVTLLFADDNWGNIRRLPDIGRPRPGGYGIYYHFDYVGGPRNYKWLNTTQIERVWEQMHLAREYGADRLWIVNVGDLKPMELPINFFLDYAWNPEAWPLERLPRYTRDWAAGQFGATHAASIAGLLDRYTRYNARRKPELLGPDKQELTSFREFYSQVNFGEAERIVADYHALAARARDIARQLPAAYQDAFFQLVQFPIEACANLNEMYVVAARNRWHAAQGRGSSGFLANRVKEIFERDAELTRQYHALGNGRWNHQMSQTHIGYDNWQQPETNVMPEVARPTDIGGRTVGVSIEGDPRAWPGDGVPVLPELNPYGAESRYIEVFSHGLHKVGTEFEIDTAQPWVRVKPRKGRADARLAVSVDWSAVPAGRHRVPITIRPAVGDAVVVEADVFQPAARPTPGSFVEAAGYAAIEAQHYARAVDANGIQWKVIPGLGRTLSSVAAFPRAVAAQTPGPGTPHLEYAVFLTSEGARDIDVHVELLPTLNFTGGPGLRYAVSIDDQPPQLVNIHAGSTGKADDHDGPWNRWVVDYVNRQKTRHRVAGGGAHTVKIWLVDPGLVFQRIIVATRPLPASVLGPPESYRAGKMAKR